MNHHYANSAHHERGGERSHRTNSSQSSTRSAPINMEVEMLVQTTQNVALQFGRKCSADKFHGWLWKKSGRFSKWRHQLFVLDGGLLSYYDTFPTGQFVADAGIGGMASDTLFTCKADTSPVGAVRVAHVERSAKCSIAFKVFAVSGKIIDLRAKNETICDQWVARLDEAATFAKRQESQNGSTTSTASSVSVALSDSEVESMINLVDKNGWLEVGDKKSQRQRYCVLQGSMFTMYDTEDPWAVPISRAYVARAEKHSSAKCELIVTTQAGKTTKNLIIKARSRDEMHIWLEALKRSYE